MRDWAFLQHSTPSCRNLSDHVNCVPFLRFLIRFRNKLGRFFDKLAQNASFLLWVLSGNDCAHYRHTIESVTLNLALPHNALDIRLVDASDCNGRDFVVAGIL